MDQARDEALAGRAEIQAIDLLHAGIAHYELGMIHLVRRELDLAERFFHHARVEPRASRASALLHFARGDAHRSRGFYIRAALEDRSRDELRRVPLLSAAVQIAVAIGDEDEAARHVRELEGIAGRFSTVGIVAASLQARTIASS